MLCWIQNHILIECYYKPLKQLHSIWCTILSKCQLKKRKKHLFRLPYKSVGCVHKQWNLSKLNFLPTNLCVQNRQVFCLYRLNTKYFLHWDFIQSFVDTGLQFIQCSVWTGVTIVTIFLYVKICHFIFFIQISQ